MYDGSVKTRFAPSPTGWLHVGNLRTALFNALVARRHGGTFLLRIEDTDAERSRSEYVADLQEDLLWLGLAWQEGPLQGGDQTAYFQSARGHLYQQYYELLEQQGFAYYCFCSDQELKLSRRRQLAAGKPPRYAGTCARLAREEAAARIQAGEQPALRFRVPRGQPVQFDDLVRGPQHFASDDIGDFIIRRANGAAAFFFCNAIDDALMGVTHVLRGEDHLANTPRQILILKSLGLRQPCYGHISMIVGHDGAPLSKRHGSRSIRELRQSGFLPEAVLNYLARLGHHYEHEQYMTLDQLAAHFDPSRFGRAPARYDGEQLMHWQREALARTDDAGLWSWLGEAGSGVPVASRSAFLDAVRPNISLPEHVQLWTRVLFADPLDLHDAAREAIRRAGAAFFASALDAVNSHGSDFKALVGHLKSSIGVRGKALFEPLRAALTGELDGPELGKLLPLMTPERICMRLRVAQQIAA
jgi:glutamyl-tRNA synthetase